MLFSDLKANFQPPSRTLVATLTPAALKVKAFLPFPSPKVNKELGITGSVLLIIFVRKFGHPG